MKSKQSRSAAIQIARTILPAGSKRRIVAGQVKRLVLRQYANKLLDYRAWIRLIEPRTLSPVLKNQTTLISIVVPCYNTPERYIKPLVESVVGQSYANWQLVITDGSTESEPSEKIKTLAATDKRIIYKKLSKNMGIAGNTNEALKMATGKYVGFLDHDDILPTWSLNEVVTAIQKNPKADVLYSDEDRLSENGKRRMTPLFKPDWSPELFFCANYVTHLCVIKSDLLKRLKGLKPDYDGSQDYDLMLRALEFNPTIAHIPKILYHMRMATGSTAASISAKSYAHNTGNKALRDYFDRNDIKAKVVNVPERPTNHRIVYELDKKTLVSIIIPFKDKADLLKKCVTSILKKTDYQNYELILISNNSTEKKTFKYVDSLKKDPKIKLLTYNQPFNFSAINNFARQKANGQVLVFLNNDTEVLNNEWLEELASVANRPEVGEVGALLFYPDRTIQHAGVVVGMLGTAGHVFRKLKLGTLTPFWLPDWPRNYLALTAACVAIETKKFDKVGGFDEEFKVAGSDVALGLALHEAGYRNVYWPFARLVHYENVTVGAYNKREDNHQDYKVSMKYYKQFMKRGDPYYNPNLDLMSEIPILRRQA